MEYRIVNVELSCSKVCARSVAKCWLMCKQSRNAFACTFLDHYEFHMSILISNNNPYCGIIQISQLVFLRQKGKILIVKHFRNGVQFVTSKVGYCCQNCIHSWQCHVHTLLPSLHIYHLRIVRNWKQQYRTCWHH